MGFKARRAGPYFKLCWFVLQVSGLGFESNIPIGISQANTLFFNALIYLRAWTSYVIGRGLRYGPLAYQSSHSRPIQSPNGSFSHAVLCSPEMNTMKWGVWYVGIGNENNILFPFRGCLVHRNREWE